MTEPKFSFDHERFIREVQSRTAIWNSNAKEYSDIELKKKCWVEIVKVFLKPDAPPADMDYYAKVLPQKWESMKNEYLSEFHQRISYTKSGIVLNDQPPYKNQFYKQLSFLQPVLPINPNYMTALHEEVDDVKEIVDVLRTGFKQRTGIEMAKETDGDRLFLLSLLDSMKKVPDGLKLSANMQIMQVIDNVCRLNASTQGYNCIVGKSQSLDPKNFSEMMQPTKKRKVDQASSANVKEIVDELRTGLKQQLDIEIAKENDGDRLFLLSLLNTMKKVPECLKLSVKIQILQVIDNACRVNMSATSGCNSTPVIDNAPKVDVSAVPGGSRTKVIDNASRVNVSDTPESYNRTTGKKKRKNRENQRKDHKENAEQYSYTNSVSSQCQASSPGSSPSRHSSEYSDESDTTYK